MKLLILLLLLILILVIIILEKNKTDNEIITTSEHINEKSFQKYAKFYGEIVLKDQEFENKINKIYNLIINKKKTNIKEIAIESNCTYEECILKIRYLKNKRQIGDYFIDHIHGTIKLCSKKDIQLLNKYKPYIYNSHLQIDEIAVLLPSTSADNIEEVKDQIFKELLYLDKKDIINGIKIDEIDKKIIYYTVEKHKKENDYISINCENCGALNYVNRGKKSKCEYCGTIIEDK